jgi:hypothetical protein
MMEINIRRAAIKDAEILPPSKEQAATSAFSVLLDFLKTSLNFLLVHGAKMSPPATSAFSVLLDFLKTSLNFLLVHGAKMSPLS